MQKKQNEQLERKKLYSVERTSESNGQGQKLVCLILRRCVCVCVCVCKRERKTEYDGALYDIKDKFITDTRFKKAKKRRGMGEKLRKEEGE